MYCILHFQNIRQHSHVGTALGATSGYYPVLHFLDVITCTHLEDVYTSLNVEIELLSWNNGFEKGLLETTDSI